MNDNFSEHGSYCPRDIQGGGSLDPLIPCPALSAYDLSSPTAYV